MPTTSKSASYNAGKSDALAGKPKNPKGHIDQAKYCTGYSNTIGCAKRYATAAKTKKLTSNPLAVCAATGVNTNEMYMGAYDSANDEFFVSPAVMDAHHGVVTCEPYSKTS